MNDRLDAIEAALARIDRDHGDLLAQILEAVHGVDHKSRPSHDALPRAAVAPNAVAFDGTSWGITSG